MTLDFDDVLLFPIYEGDIASDATLTLANGASYSALPDGTALRVIDHTAGLAVTQSTRGAKMAPGVEQLVLFHFGYYASSGRHLHYRSR